MIHDKSLTWKPINVFLWDYVSIALEELGSDW